LAAFEGFTNLYSVSKTLCFELMPMGKTLEHIQKNNILANDEHRAESYKKVKKIIDEYHKDFISTSLKNVVLDDALLSDYYQLRMENDISDAGKKNLIDIQAKLRKQIANAFDTERLFGKKLIKEHLLNFDFVKRDIENINLVSEFKKFTSYFVGFHENRKNIYSDEYKTTAIAFRLIHDNLPKHIGNMAVFEKIKKPLAKNLKTLSAKIGKYDFSLSGFNKTLTQDGIDYYNLVIGGKVLEGGTRVQGLNEYINMYNQKQRDKDARLPKFTQLYKQILSDRETLSWQPEKFESDNQVLENIKKIYRELPIAGIKRLISKLSSYDLSNIY
jgi:CRISPR-associated protein Cpf1